MTGRIKGGLLASFLFLGVIGTAEAFRGTGLPGPSGNLLGGLTYLQTQFCQLSGGTGCAMTGTIDAQATIQNTTSAVCSGEVGALCVADAQGMVVHNGSAAVWTTGSNIYFINSAGSLMAGTINGSSLVLNGSLSVLPGSPSVMTGDWNDYALTAYGVLRIDSGASPRSITGLQYTYAVGQRLVLCVVGANAVTLVHESASSLAGNRFKLPGGTNRVIAVDECVEIIYDGATIRWRIIN